jgi:shikimate dehydrogenase
VNTVIRRGNRHVGFNTDVSAALRVLERALSVRDRRVALLGAGGAGAAIARALHRRGALVTIYNRNPDRARRLADAIGCQSGALHDYGGKNCDILINATSVGMYPHVGEIPVPAETLRAGWVFDLVYNPPETLLLREARKRSIRTLSGLEMFLEQAGEQFQIFTGKPPPGEVMRRAAERALGFAAPGEDRNA